LEAIVRLINSSKLSGEMGFDSCDEEVEITVVFYGRRNESVGYCMSTWWLVFMGFAEVLH
jgi:hypothetical protein